MTARKAITKTAKGNGKSRFPEGMTTKKAKAKAGTGAMAKATRLGEWPLFLPARTQADRWTRSPSGAEEVFGGLDQDVSCHVANGFGEGELFGAGVYAVLGEAAFLDSSVAGKGAETLFF